MIVDEPFAGSERRSPTAGGKLREVEAGEKTIILSVTEFGKLREAETGEETEPSCACTQQGQDPC